MIGLNSKNLSLPREKSKLILSYLLFKEKTHLYFLLQHQQSGTLGNAMVRCDKLDQSEIKSLLMCFLYILKSMSDGR